ncbi:MAG: HEAT repeat domain-containing protein [Verrucomicrobiota bacterium]|jgi:HEAT repeat protein
MTKKGIILSLVVLAAAAGIWWLLRMERPGGSAPPGPAPAVEAAKPPAGTGSNAAPQVASLPVAPQPSQPKAASGRSKQQRAELLAALKGASVDSAKRAQVVATLDDEKKLYNYAGEMGWDDAKALIAKRQQATKDLENRLAAMGQGGANAIAATYADVEDVRGRMMLLHALGTIQDDQAGGLLQALLDSENSLSLQREIIDALSLRHDADTVALLAQIAAEASDSRLRFAAVQGLAGREDGLSALQQLMQTETDPEVQKAIVLAVGGVHTAAAQSLLASVAQGAMDPSIRQMAIQALARSFGAGALSVFQQLLSDPNEAIRENAVTAVAQLHSDQAVALLQQTAASDSSAQVRAKAQAALSAVTPQ